MEAWMVPLSREAFQERHSDGIHSRSTTPINVSNRRTDKKKGYEWNETAAELPNSSTEPEQFSGEQVRCSYDQANHERHQAGW
jgi:hypothetical protein